MKYNIFFDNVGISNQKYIGLTHKIMDEYASGNSICTIGNPEVLPVVCDKVAESLVIGDIHKMIDSHSPILQQFKPVDEHLIVQMAPYEHECIQVMSRSMGYKDYLSRIDFYYDSLRYWNGMLDKYQVNLYITEAITHELNGMLVYYLCKVKGISTINIADSVVPHYSLLSRGIDCVAPYDTDVHSDKLNKENQDMLDSFMDHRADITPEYAKQNSVASMQAIRLKRDFRLSLFRRIAYGFLMFIQVVLQTENSSLIRFLIRQQGRDYLGTYKEAISYYRRNSTRVNPAEKFIYVPLHLQPEQTTLPMAGKYENQLLYIKMLSYYLPEGYFIYVKEHPAQFDANWAFPLFRDIRYYQALERIDKVRLISIEEDSYELIERCTAVAVATGTVGLEAIFRDKQVLMFGSRVFQNAPGVYRIHTAEDCEQALAKILEMATVYKTNREQMEKWLRKVQDCSFKNCGHIDYKIARDNVYEEKYVFDRIKDLLDSL